MTMRRKFAPSVLSLVAAAMLCCHLGCASIDHINTYRGIRSEFNNQAKEHNERVLADAFAPLDPADAPAVALDGVLNKSTLQSLQDEADAWQTVFEEARALNKRAEKELRADELFGASRTMEIVAEARASTCRHLLATSTAAAPATQPSEPITAAVAQAEAVLNDKSIKLFDRDRYMLQTLRPIARYEIAIVELRRAVVSKRADNLDTIDPIEAAIAQADREYDEGMSRYPDNALAHATLARLIMLQSGETIVVGEKFLNHVNHQLDDATLHRPGIAAIVQRIDHFREQALKPDGQTQESKLLAGLSAARGSSTSEQTLDAVGLSALTRTSP